MPFVPDQPVEPGKSRFVPDAAPPVTPPVEEPVARPWQAGDPVPKGFHAVTINGNKELRKDFTFTDALSSLPPVGIMETITEGVTGGLSKAASGFAGLFKGATEGRDAAADTVRQVQEDYTYEPVSSSAADIKSGLASMLGLADPIAEPIQRGIDKLPDGAATIVNAAVEAAPEVLPLAASMRPAAAAVKARAPKKAEPPPAEISPKVKELRQAGYTFRPSDVEAVSPGSKPPGRFAESLNDPSDLKRHSTKTHQQVTTRLAAEELGLKNTTALTDREFNKVKAPHVKVYDEAETALNRVAPPPEFKALLQEATDRAKFKPGTKPTVTRTIGALRRRATKQIQAKDVATQEAGYADQAMADRLEEAFGARLEALGDEKAFKKYQESREAFAKIYNIETATRAGQVDAHAIYKQKKRGAKLTGRLSIIADAAEHIPNTTRHSLSTATGGIPKADTVAGVVKNVATSALRKTPGMKKYLDVRSPEFQNRLGPEGDEARRSYFGDRGRKQPPVEAPAPPVPQLGTETLEFVPGAAPRPGVRAPDPDPTLPSAELARDLGLMPDPVPNAQMLPDAPDMLTADTVPPIRGDIDFEPSAPPLAQTMAQELELDRQMAPAGDMIEWAQPNLADLLVGDQRILPDQLNLGDQIGFNLDTMYSPLMEQRPLGDLIAPPGSVGKPKRKK